MRFIELEFELKSPTIVTFKRTTTGFLMALRYIPASTLRGSLISSMYRAGTLDGDLLKREAEEPCIISSPAYPVYDGKRAYPCHPFAYECKFRHEDSKKYYRNYVSEVLPVLEKELEPKYEISCPQGHLAIKPLHPNPVILNGESLKKASVYSYRTISVGMSKSRAAPEKNMLFEYEAISAGQRFWSTLAIPDSLSIENNMEFAVGRGISRGFGRARVKSINEMSLKEQESLVENSLKDNTIVFYSISQTLSINSDRYRAYPESIKLSEIAKRCGFEAEGKIVFKSAYGKASQLVAGWDMMKNAERPTFNSAGNSGSVLVANLVKGENMCKAIAALGFVGTVELALGMSIVGVNMLVPLRGHRMEGEKG
ncbi:MAG: hypothetical protein ACUVQY_05240 [Thermoproteota archaeon]